MGHFLPAVGDILTNDSAWRNAMITAVLLFFAASGELIAEKAGTINISLEGMMLAGAFLAAIGYHIGNSVWMGLLFAGAAGLLLAPVPANMSPRFPAHPFVVGLVLQLLVLVLVGFLASSINQRSLLARPV